MRFHAKHGFYEEEQILGTWYVVDVQITTDLSEAAASDELARTINYETVYEICRIVMETPNKLLETIVKRIVAGLKHQFPRIHDVTVSLKKMNPPLGGQVAYSRVDSSGLIALGGMRFYGRHGWHEEEQVLGEWFMVDVQISTNLSAASASDELAHTINYETVYEICRIAMETPTQLLETIAKQVIADLKHQFQTIQDVTVSIKKENPSIGGEVAQARIEESEEYSDDCGRCGRPIICYGDTDCWCNSITVHPRTQEAIQQQYRKCLCKNCLDFYAN
jgi:dihydroneopterin aldolase